MKNIDNKKEYMSTLRKFFGKRLARPYVIEGDEAGPTVAIFAGVHGNEHCGLKALAKLLPTLSVRRGKVIFLIGNPPACLRHIRYGRSDLNLNRFGLPAELLTDNQMNSYEFERSMKMKKLLGEADILLDIHSGTALVEPIIICERNACHLAQYLPREFTRQVYGFDAIEPGAWDGYMLSLGKPGITIECGFHEDPNGPRYALLAICTLLRAAGCFGTRPIAIQKRKEVQMFHMYRTKTDVFTLARDFQSLGKLAKGEVIGRDGEIEVLASSDCLIVFPHNCTEVNAEAFLLGHEI